ncbi:MAG: hypothetical protein IPG71_12475 [bacterium]|nr:hypothetical protein [bacterium]
MSAITVPTPVFRPKRLPRVLRRQANVIRLVVGLVLFAVVALLIAWRNFQVQQRTIDVARQRSHLLQLDQELQHLNGLIDAAAPYPMVSAWALEKRGWKDRQTRIDSILVVVPTPAQALGNSHDGSQTSQ